MIDELYDKSDDSFLAIALEIDRMASQDKYFTSRRLKANADLYLNFAYMALYVSPIICQQLSPEWLTTLIDIGASHRKSSCR